MTQLPILREELALHPGIPSFDGSPTWIIHDPIRNRFFSIGNSAFEILARWIKGNAEDIVESVNLETTVPITIDDVDQVSIFLCENELTVPIGMAGTLQLSKSTKQKSRPWLLWLFHNYLFFKCPIIRPDYFLSATINMFRWVYSKLFFQITLLVLFIGIFTVIRQWEKFASTFLNNFSWDGIMNFVLALIVVKVVHEFAHAYTAKRYGCRIPSMGVAFLVLWPMPYTDMTDVWKLKKRHQRIAVAAAGVCSELIVASWATMAWCVLPSGVLSQVAFFLATTTWISSITINMFPFLRFDGYYILADWLGMENLHARSFAIGRWWVREKLFDLKVPPPEDLPKSRKKFLVFFAFLVWIYRLIIFTGIAVLVYHFFTKVVGVILFVAEIGWFIFVPILNELKHWFRLKKIIVKRKRSLLTLSLFFFVIALGLIPWKTQITAPALMRAEKQVKLVTVAPGKLKSFSITNGQLVGKNDLIASLENPDLEYQLARINAQIMLTNYELEASQLGSSWQKQSNILLSDLARLHAEAALFLEKKGQLIIRAPFNGRLVDKNPLIDPGQWVDSGQNLVTLRSSRGAIIIAYVDETEIHYIDAKSKCIFFADTGDRAGLPCKIAIIETAAYRKLKDIALATTFNGSIPARIKNGSLIMDRTYYKVMIKPENNKFELTTQLRGVVQIGTPRQAPISYFLKFMFAVLIRESGM